MTTTRVTNKTVVFSRPFVLNEADGEQPPGIYTVETEEERLDVMSISAYRRVSTVMNHYNQYAGGRFIRFVAIDPRGARCGSGTRRNAALARDAEINQLSIATDEICRV